MELYEKEVYYNQYCKTCKYVNETETVDGVALQGPHCEECLNTPMNIESHKPVNYKEVNK